MPGTLANQYLSVFPDQSSYNSFHWASAGSQVCTVNDGLRFDFLVANYKINLPSIVVRAPVENGQDELQPLVHAILAPELARACSDIHPECNTLVYFLRRADFSSHVVE